mgnify:CR=1 FL=1
MSLPSVFDSGIIAIAVNKQVLPERICILIGCAFGESSLEVAEKGLGHSIVPTAVLYTHLTLPTILLV